jgi:hypothetical protein
VSLDDFPVNQVLSKMTLMTGTFQGVSSASLVIDGRLDQAIPAQLSSDGRWHANLEPSTLSDGPHSLIVSGSSPSGTTLSVNRNFEVSVPWALERSTQDVKGDDHGPSGKYLYPTSPGFEGRADIGKVSVYRRGASSKISIQMVRGISAAWNPPLGFDHVAFHVFIGFPQETGGMTVLPGLNAEMPSRIKWRYCIFAGGWKTTLHEASRASAATLGPPLLPAPQVMIDPAKDTIEFILNRDSFKNIPSFDGARYYITTWDYDGGESFLRPLMPAAGPYTFGGGYPGDPLIMDDVML